MSRGRELPRWVGAAVACAGLGLMLLGAARGEMTVVFHKAIRICLECIGIG